jgi:hypothetical protein
MARRQYLKDVAEELNPYIKNGKDACKGRTAVKVKLDWWKNAHKGDRARAQREEKARRGTRMLWG